MATVDTHPDARLAAAYEDLDFYHVDWVQIGPDMSALDLYQAMVSYNPFPLRMAFLIRDIIGRIFRLKPVHGFRGGAASEDISAGDYLDFFEVLDVSDKELNLISRDRHLEVVVALNLIPHETGGGNWLCDDFG